MRLASSEICVDVMLCNKCRLILFVVLVGLVGCADGEPATPTGFPLPTRAIEAREVVVTGEPVTATPTPRPEVAAETEHLIFYEAADVPVAPAAWQAEAEAAYDYVSAQLDGGLRRGKIPVFFARPGTEPCRARGLTFPPHSDAISEITIFADETADRDYLLGVLAHEIGHVIIFNGVETDFVGVRSINEGLATWASRDYWTAWQGVASLDAAVRDYVAGGTYLPLTEDPDLSSVYPSGTPPAGECLERRDTLYTEWASFVDYLLQHRGGMAKLQELVATASSTAEDGTVFFNPPDYQAVYGHHLNQLEAAWLRQIGAAD